MDASYSNLPLALRKSTVGPNIGIFIAPKHHSLDGIIHMRCEELQEL
jgi:hypothetical protein